MSYSNCCGKDTDLFARIPNTDYIQRIGICLGELAEFPPMIFQGTVLHKDHIHSHYFANIECHTYSLLEAMFLFPSLLLRPNRFYLHPIGRNINGDFI